MTDQPLICCMCPTYKRPECAANALACFLAQDYPNKFLIIYDDAGQFYGQLTNQYQLISTTERVPTLMQKYNKIANWRPSDILTVWEDDDVYLPWHLSEIVIAWKKGAGFIHHGKPYEDYGQPPGHCTPCMIGWDEQTPRWHSSWAYDTQRYLAAGGYPDTPGLDFDLQLMRRMLELGAKTGLIERPSYVYHYGNTSYHGSQCQEGEFLKHYERLENQDSPFVGDLVPKFNQYTDIFYKNSIFVR